MAWAKEQNGGIMRFPRLKFFGAALATGMSVLAMQSAHASMSGPSQIQIDGGPIGPLQFSGGFDGYGYAMNNSLTGTKSTGFQLGNALVELQKSTGVVQFTLEVGAYSYYVLGYPPATATAAGQNYFAESPLYAGYVTIAPNSHVSFSAGQLNSLEGYEGAQDWNNYNLLVTELFYVENAQNRGFEVAANAGKFSATVSISDGYFTKVINYLQYLLTYTPNTNSSFNLFGGANLGTTGPNVTGIGNLLYNNSTMIGAYYTYTNGNFTMTPEVQYQRTGAVNKYAGAGYQIGAPVSNIGAALFGDYQFGSNGPWSIGAFAEYASESYSKTATYSGVTPDYFGFGAGSHLYGLSITPTWQYKDIFARADVGYIHVQPGSGGSAFGTNGFAKNQITGVLEAGLLF
jgi:hypothetical protein